MRIDKFFKTIASFFICSMCLFAAQLVSAQTDEALLAKETLTAAQTSTVEACVIDIGKKTSEVFVPINEASIFESDGPSAFALDKNENFYILDTCNFKVMIVSKNKIIKTFEYPQGETGDQKYFVRDIAVSPKDGNIYLLNRTLNNVFVYSPEGKLVKDVNMKEEAKGVQKIFIAPDGKILVRDEEEPKILIYSSDGKFIGKYDGAMVSNIINEEGYLYALGEFDKTGRDILLLDPLGGRNPKVYAKIANSSKNDPFDYQIIGVDGGSNLYALAVEQPEFDVSKNIISKFDKAGKLVERLLIANFWGVGTALPVRQYAVSPSGGLYVFDIDAVSKKFYIYKIEKK